MSINTQNNNKVHKPLSSQIEVNYLHDRYSLRDVIEIICNGKSYYVERSQDGHGLNGIRTGSVPSLTKGEWRRTDLLELADNYGDK